MQMTISGHHLTVTDPIRNYVSTKLLKLERRYELITKIVVTLTVDKLVQKAEATVHARGAEIFANSEHEDLYAAIDALSEKLNKQVIKHKQKQRGR
jgi:putative sigma-54 modulation protein